MIERNWKTILVCLAFVFVLVFSASQVADYWLINKKLDEIAGFNQANFNRIIWLSKEVDKLK